MRIAVVIVVPMVGSVRGARLARSIDAAPADQGHLTTRSSLLLTLIACHLLLAYVARARHFAFEPAWWRAKPMLASIVGSILLQVVAYTTPTGRELLGLSAVPPVAWLIAGGAAISMVGVLDVRSALRRRHGG